MKARRIFKTFSILILFSCICSGFWWGYKYYLCSGPSARYNGEDYDAYLNTCAVEAQDYSKKRGLNQEYCVLVDYGIPSGTPRVFVWSFKEKKVVYGTYTMHGPGMGSTDEHPVFSNKNGSHCSTLGHFAITKEHGRRQKRGYKMKGMDLGNSNAYARGIMLHRSKWVDSHCWMEYIPLNPKSCLGCVTVSSRGMNYLEKLINSQPTQLLLWSFDSTKNLMHPKHR